MDMDSGSINDFATGAMAIKASLIATRNFERFLDEAIQDGQEAQEKIAAFRNKND